MEDRLPGIWRLAQKFSEGRALKRTRAVVQAPRRLRPLQCLGHGDNRRDTDSARNQEVMACLITKGEIVGRRGYLQLVSHADMVVHLVGAATAARLPLDTYHVAMSLLWIVSERVLPDQTGRKED